VGNIGSVLNELSLSENSDHAYKAKEALDYLVEKGVIKPLNSDKNTLKLGKSNCTSLCFCPHIGSGK
jgi:hypothetical protein